MHRQFSGSESTPMNHAIYGDDCSISAATGVSSGCDEFESPAWMTCDRSSTGLVGLTLDASIS